MRIIICLTVLLFLLPACGDAPPDTAVAVEEMMTADRAFSSLSEKEGMKNAFLAYAAEEGVLLRSNRMPVVGKAAIQNLLEPVQDSTFTLTWEPLYGSVANSGELGYTYGTYLLEVDTLQEKGTYVSIWQKDVAGTWKYVLDTGNERVGE